MSKNLVEIRPIVNKKWHGKVGKESFTRPKKIQALICGETMQYKTGLDNVSKNYKHPETGNPITELEYYGLLLKQDLNPIASAMEAHSFWDSSTAVVKLEESTIFFNKDIPLDYIKYKICTASRFVANSMKEYEEGLFPDATHVIFSETEEVEAKASKVELKKQAIITCAELPVSRKIQLCMIIGGKCVKNQSTDYIEVTIDELIEKRAAEILHLLQQDKEDMALHAMVLEAIQKGFLRNLGHKIMFYDSVLGSSVEDVITYFKNLENQDLKLRLMSQLNPT